MSRDTLALPDPTEPVNEIDTFLACYPPAVVRQVGVLRRLVRRAAPDAALSRGERQLLVLSREGP